MFAFKKIYLLSEIISCSRIINQKIDMSRFLPN